MTQTTKIIGKDDNEDVFVDNILDNLDETIKEKQNLLKEIKKGFNDLSKDSSLYNNLSNQITTLENEIKAKKLQKKILKETINDFDENIDTDVNETFKNYRKLFNYKLILRGIMITCIFVILLHKDVRNIILSYIKVSKSNYLYLAIIINFFSYLLIHLF